MMDVWWACRADINIMDVMHAASGYSPTPRAIEVDCIMGSMTCGAGPHRLRAGGH